MAEQALKPPFADRGLGPATHRMMAFGGRNNCRKDFGDYNGDSSSKQPFTQPKDVKRRYRSQPAREPCKAEPHQWDMQSRRMPMTKFALLGAAALLSLTAATPPIAQEVIYDPGYCAQFYPNANCQNKDRTIPTPATISAGWTRATLTSSAPVRARRARSSISAAVATASIATGNLESPAASIGGREVTRWRFPFP